MNNGIFSSLSGRSMILIAIAIIAVSYSLFFYFQGMAEDNFRASLFQQQEQRQLDSTKAIAQHIESDLDGISSKMGLIAARYNMADTNLPGEEKKMREFMEQVFTELNVQRGRPLSRTEITNDNASSSPSTSSQLIDGIYILDENGIVTTDVRAEGVKNIEGQDLSARQYVSDSAQYLLPQFSTGYVGSDGKFRIAATYPIIGPDGVYKGLVAATMPTDRFFQHYGNVYDIKSQYIVALDIGSVQLVHPVPSLVGNPFFGEFTQNITSHNDVLNSLVRKVMSGMPGYAIYSFVNGERLTSGYPIYLGGQPTYFVFVITPTSTIYSAVDHILNAQRFQTFSVLAGTTVTIAALIFLLVRWNRALNKEVKMRTLEITNSNQQLLNVNARLEESNKQLAFANERLLVVNDQLQQSERAQKEFINIAAHELRTPIQPILGLAEILQAKNKDPETKTMLDTINRNANRLEQLATNILDVTRIESQSLKLRRDRFGINDTLVQAIEDFRNQLHDNQITLDFQPEKEVFVFADRERIYQVIHNLLSNAIKFAPGGKIVVQTNVQDGNQRGRSEVVVTMSDNGSGIDQEVLPKLFTRFATKSEQGTGLGLYISKSIIGAHDGKIWAENNNKGKGAIFHFSLPLADK